MKRLIALLCVAVFAGPALAHWDEGDPYKMHFPQLPDEDGWDVKFHNNVPQLADDWMCSDCGWVKDIHFWISWKDDNVHKDDVARITVSIHADIPDPDGDGPLYSMPGDELWYREFFPPGDFTIVGTSGQGPDVQGWYDPTSSTNGVEQNNHGDTYQINIPNIHSPFQQKKGTIYWLAICLWGWDEELEDYGPLNFPAGWKTADVDRYPEHGHPAEHFRDDAVWRTGRAPWEELRDPVTDESLDLAFVITGDADMIPTVTEWGLIVMTGLVLVAGAIVIRRRRAMAA